MDCKYLKLLTERDREVDDIYNEMLRERNYEIDKLFVANDAKS